MHFLLPLFRAEGVLSCEEISATRRGVAIMAAGLVLIRQRPGKGNAVFITLEDETGIINVLVWARLFELFRSPIMRSEEHTSELQSLMRISYAVLCLKKKDKTSHSTSLNQRK